MEDRNIVAIKKNEEKYIFIYYDSRKEDMLRRVGRYASDPNLSFSWYDAAIVSQKMKNNVESNY